MTAMTQFMLMATTANSPTDVFWFDRNRSDFVFTALPDDPLGGKGVLVTSALDAFGAQIVPNIGTDRIFGVESFRFADGTFTRNEVLGVTPENVLDFSVTGLIADFDNDPTTPDAAAASVQVELSDVTSANGGSVLSNYINQPAFNLFTVADFNASPDSITRVIGTAGGDVFSNYTTNTGRTVVFEGRDGDDVYRANIFTGGDSFDGGQGSDKYFIGSFFLEPTTVSVDFGIVNPNGFATVTMISATGGTKTNQIKSVEEITTSWEDSDDTIDASSLSVDFIAEVYSGTDTVTTGSGNDQVLVGAGVKTIDGGSGTDLLNYSGLDTSQTFRGVTIDLATGTAYYLIKNNQPGVPIEVVSSTALNFENAFGTFGNDDIIGTTDDNELNGLDGDDSLFGGLGADTLRGAIGNDRFFGGAGADLIFGGNDIVVGTELDTAIYAGNYADYTIGTDATFTPRTFVIETASSEEDSLYSIEKIEFWDGIYDVATGVFSQIINTAPDAIDDLNAVVQEDGTLLLDVLANDTDADGDPLTITAIGIAPALASQVSVSIENNQIRITPAENWSGSFSFSYTIFDGRNGYDTANVNVDVQSVNDDPVAADDQFFQALCRRPTLTLTRSHSPSSRAPPEATLCSVLAGNSPTRLPQTTMELTASPIK
jgi:Ca2+-binding RTX toxin-like protein